MLRRRWRTAAVTRLGTDAPERLAALGTTSATRAGDVANNLDVLDDVDVPAPLLHRRRRDLGRDGGHAVPRRPRLGRVRRPLRRPRRRPDPHAGGASSARTCSSARCRCCCSTSPIFTVPDLGGTRQARLRLRHLRAVRARLQPREHPVRLARDGDDAGPGRAGQARQRPGDRHEPRDPPARRRRLAADRGLGRPPALADDHHDRARRSSGLALYLSHASSPRRERVQRNRRRPSSCARRSAIAAAEPAAGAALRARASLFLVGMVLAPDGRRSTTRATCSATPTTTSC